ncbi:MAG: hypothetical protein CVU05_06420 [Bacteroidetes bacterium HGW-Bacteroidetes-21]|nr:MAG: hypothetical protein CVU05_06420 [Bacteroidetes bacterium HGW-Bacteroidetes-21]
MKKLLLQLFIFLLIGTGVSGQTDIEKGGIFNFKTYQHNTINKYKAFKQTDIKAVKISVRTIKKSDKENAFLFYPGIRSNNNISLIDLLLWAIKEKNLPAYSAEDITEFETKTNWADIEEHFGIQRKVNEDGNTVIEGKIKSEEVISYLIMESTIYGTKGQILAVRPMGLCPIHSFVKDDEEVPSDTLKRKICWVYFPDIANLLSNYIPAEKIKGVKSTYDFFTKNLYKGDYFTYYHSNTWLTDSWVWGDTTQQFVEGFDVSWIYKRNKDGMFVSPFNSLYQGNPEIKTGQYYVERNQPAIDPANIFCAKIKYETINLRDTENYPLYFPEIPFRGQKSLIDAMLEGIKAGKINCYDYESIETPLTIQEVEKNLGMSTDTIYVQDVTTGEFKNMVIDNEIASYEVKKYILRYIDIYDQSGKIFISKLEGIIPIREYYRRDDVEVPQVLYRKVFYVPFNELIQYIFKSSAYHFSISDNISQYVFLALKKYKASEERSEEASLAFATKELGISNRITENKTIDNPTYSSTDKPKLVYRRINIDVPENGSLFSPTMPQNGLLSFFDFSLYCTEHENLTFYENNTGGKFTSPLTLEKIDLILGAISDTLLIEDINTGELVQIIVPGYRHSEEIKSYILQEIHSNGKITITGICPVRELFMMDSDEPVYKKTYWIPFSGKFFQLMANQEIFRPNCEQELNFRDYFVNQKYKGEIIEEKEISADEANKIIETVK